MIAGTRVPIDLILVKISDGMRIDEVAAAYGLVHDDILAALTYAAK